MSKILYEDLNNCQKKVADAFSEFLHNGEKFFILSSEAGTGKTFLTNYLYHTVFPEYLAENQGWGYHSFALTATTNKASCALAESVGIEVPTVHSHFGFIVSNDYATGKVKLDLRKAKYHCNEIILVDECSMIDKQLFDALMTYSKNCKWVFVGDDKQLPPINSKISPVFLQSNNINRLNQVMRNNAHNELLEACRLLRVNVDTKTFPPIEIKGNLHYCTGAEFQKAVDEHFLHPSLKSRILAYTNQRCIDYSNYINKQLRGYTEDLVEGNYYVNSSMCLNSSGDKIYTEELVKLLGIDDEVSLDPVNNLFFKSLTVKRSNGSLFTTKACLDKTIYKNTLKQLAKDKNWKAYFYTQDTYIDLRDISVSTVHKSQGMTLDNVFIDLNDIGTCRNPSTLARLLYVAFSRAKEHIFLRGNLPNKFGEFIKYGT